ncbi:MAG TPA: ABC transporter ATP-binding protein [Comamonadaceae bacterium]|nr:ABC transporter ATP-binding protein [Comamonadaceae bacterium]
MSGAVPSLSFERLVLGAGGRTLLHGVDLQVPARGLLGLVGANGAGKTSLLRAALGLLVPQAGRVLVQGRVPQQWDAHELARHVGYVAQASHSHWDLTVHEALHLHPAARTGPWVQRCELSHLLERRLCSLSGGERARVALARALAHGPALLLADEPAAHLDIPHHHRLMALLREAAGECAVVIVLHDLHVAARYCDRLALLGQGRLLAHGAPGEVLTPALLAQAYGAPVAALQAQGQRFFTQPEASA